MRATQSSGFVLPQELWCINNVRFLVVLLRTLDFCTLPTRLPIYSRRGLQGLV